MAKPDFYDYFKKYQLDYVKQLDLYFQYKINGCCQSKKKLILSFMPMALKICEKYYKKADGLVSMSELFDECYLIINEAIDIYKPISKLSTFVYKMVCWALSNMVSNAFTIVRYPSEIKKEMKEAGVSMNWVSLEEITYYKEGEDDNASDD